MAKKDYDFELIFDDLVDRFLEEGKDYEWIEETLKNEVDRAIAERQAGFETDE
jgi:uncharacterized protein YheU (UPF0270 family)